MNRINSMYLVLFLTLVGSVYSTSALALECMREHHQKDLCIKACSIMIPYGYSFCF